MDAKHVRVGIVGISGYSGASTFEILLGHPHVRVTYVSAGSTTGPVTDIWPQFLGQTNLTCAPFDLQQAISHCDLVFLATPHSISMTITPHLLAAGLKVIDLSGDYRFKSGAAYKKSYGTDHSDKTNLSHAVYGLPEFYRPKIRKAKLIANPGCYPTAALISLAPVLAIYGDQIESVIIDAKSGVSGAGRKVALSYIFPEVNENFKAYKVLAHQHAPEIEQYLSPIAGKKIKIYFVPHLLPVNRGILETIYLPMAKSPTLSELHSVYRKYYKTEPFVRILPIGALPELKHVALTNYCDIGLSVSLDRSMIVITSAIDNLIKGAAGQAVQNMNILFGFEETLGLK